MLHYEKRSVAKSLAAIVGLRSMVLETLSLIDDHHWQRTMTMEDGSTITLAGLVEKADGHIVGHTQQLISLSALI